MLHALVVVVVFWHTIHDLPETRARLSVTYILCVYASSISASRVMTE